MQRPYLSGAEFHLAVREFVVNGSQYLDGHAPLAILPVLAFLSALVWLDSFKLLTVRFVLGVVLSGALAAQRRS